MDYELSDAHKLIRDTAKRIAREKVAPRVGGAGRDAASTPRTSSRCSRRRGCSA